MTKHGEHTRMTNKTKHTNKHTNDDETQFAKQAETQPNTNHLLDKNMWNKNIGIRKQQTKQI